jgi:hypothetical protein
MTISTQIVAVTSSAQLVAGLAPARIAASVEVYNLGSTTVYVGGASVTTANGRPILAGNAFTCDLASSDQMYVIAASTGSVAVFQAGA